MASFTVFDLHDWLDIEHSHVAYALNKLTGNIIIILMTCRQKLVLNNTAKFIYISLVSQIQMKS